VTSAQAATTSAPCGHNLNLFINFSFKYQLNIPEEFCGLLKALQGETPVWRANLES
jgi:hypothetical protein